MTTRATTSEPDLPADGMCSPIPDALRDPVEAAPRPPAVPEPELLPFSERTSRDFERCCLAIAEHVDGLRDARLYGVSGQAQEGIDLVGFDASGSVVYQAKRYEEFLVTDLEAAVKKFAGGRRPFRPRRLVLCVSSVVERTEVIERFAELKRTADFELDLYDAKVLSDRLLRRPELVKQLFGTEWMQRFCQGVSPAPPRPDPTDRLADSVLRGPLRALGLEAPLAEAGAAAGSGAHDQAVKLLREIIHRLDDEGFAAFTDGPRRQLADALIGTGQVREAAEVLARMAWTALTTGPNHVEHHDALRRLHDLRDRCPEAAPLARALHAIDDWLDGPEFDIQVLAALTTELAGRHAPLADEVLLWAAEAAVAAQDAVGLRAFGGGLAELAQRRRDRTGPDDEMHVRAACCLAELSRDWTAVVRDARRGTFGPKLGSLALARAGRSFAWNLMPDDADDAFRAAVQLACTAHVRVDAAHALRSAANVRMRYGPVDDFVFGAGRLAARVDGGTDGRAESLVVRGLAMLARQRRPDALRTLRFALHDHVRDGHLDGELDCHAALAQLLAECDEPTAALRHALLAGSGDIVKKIGSSSLVPSVTELSGAPPWTRALGYAVVAQRADQLPDGQIDELVAAAFSGIDGVRQGWSGPNVSTSAWRLLASVAERMSRAQGERALDALLPYVPRSKNAGYLHDAEHVAIVAAVHKAHADLHPRTIPHLQDLIASAGDVADQVYRKAGSLVRRNPAPFVPALRTMADDGNVAAFNLLLDVDQPTPAMMIQAVVLAQSVLDRPEPDPNAMSVGTNLGRCAYAARLVDEQLRRAVVERLLHEARDHRRIESNRVEAVQAVRAFTDRLPDDVRRRAFASCMEIARDPGPVHAWDARARASLHPLSTFRMDMPLGVLAVQSARTAASLARAEDEVPEVVAFLEARLLDHDDGVASSAALGLNRIDPQRWNVDLRQLAAMPRPWARQLAAVAWGHHPDLAPELGRSLATDADPDVRRSLASALSALRDRRPDLLEDVAEVLRADPHWTVRHQVPPASS